MKMDKEVKNLILLSKYYKLRKLNSQLKDFYQTRAKIAPLAYANKK